MNLILPAAAFVAVVAIPAAALAEPAAVNSAETTYAKSAYTIRWALSKPGAAVDVFVASSPDDRPAALKRIDADDHGETMSVTDPLGRLVRPYFYLLPKGAKQGYWTATRVVPLEGASNFRDLGGYVAAGGRRVVWGKLFRSNGLSNLTTSDYKVLDGMDVRVVCDLRTQDERTRQPTVWQGQRPQFDESPKASIDFDTRGLFGMEPPDPAKVRTALTSFYGVMIDSYADEYRNMFRRLLAGDAPLIMHCSAGKDRTGVGSALILTALGVPRQTVVADYALSQQLLYGRDAGHGPKGAKPDPTTAMFAGLPPAVAEAFLASDPTYIEAALSKAAAEYGSVDRYLEKRLGVGPKERAALRAQYLQ